jgi:hypothetical protein
MLLVGFVLTNIKTADFDWFLGSVSKKLLVFLTLLYSMFTVDFMTKKNQLVLQNSYAILVYVLLHLLFSQVFTDLSTILANFFILLALRRCISLKSKIDTEKKIFDASLWIGVAFIFNFWAIGFLLILFLSIIFYAYKGYKNWLIPFVGLFFVLVLTETIYYSLYNTFFIPVLPVFDTTWLGQSLKSLYFIPILVLVFWALISYFKTLSSKTLDIKRSFIILFLIFILSFMLFLIANENLLFVFFPISVLVANLFQEIKNRFVLEIISYFLLLLAVLHHVLY